MKKVLRMPTLSLFGIVSALALFVTFSAFADIDFTIPKTWKAEEAKGFSRVKQYHVQRSKGDANDAKVIVYFFKGKMGGGSIDDNVARWKKQVKQGPNDPAPKKSERTCNGHKVTLYDQTGTYTPPPFARRPAQKDTRLIRAVIETKDGNYFVKFIGPKQTVADNHKNFLSWLDSVKAEKATGTAKPSSRPTSRPASRPASRPGS